MSRNCKRDELARLQALAQTARKNARIDLDAFLALDEAQRAARWQQWDAAAKFQAVAQQIARKIGDWDADLVALWIARYDAKWGTAPATVDAAVVGALEELADAAASSARTARAAGLKDDATFFQRAANAYATALAAYQAGVRPELLDSGAYLLPSRTDGPAHLLRKDGDWVCTCASGSHIHWASALIIGLETAADTLDRTDDPMPDYNGGAAALGRRLAAARARLDVAA